MLITGDITVLKPKFPMPDLLADADAKNLSQLYNEDDSLSEIVKDYYLQTGSSKVQNGLYLL